MEKLCKKCVVLYSGGLDSLLAVHIMLSLNFEVYPLFVKTPFYNKDEKQLKKGLSGLPVKLYMAENDKEYLELVKHPKFGYGKNLNPCVDCKIFFLQQAKRFMDEIEACFVVTGEVLGQRPMSQRSYSVMRAIEKRADLSDTVLRPLSAKCLPKTKMEEEGIVDRDKLFCITGRSRKEQFEIAKLFGIEEFESPAGGCLLTDASMSKRVKEMLEYGYVDKYELGLLTLGRHFRINSKRFVVSRKKDETYLMLKRFGGILPLLRCHNAPGAIGVFVNEPDSKEIEIASAILKRYSKKAETFEYSYKDEVKIVQPGDIKEDELELLKI